MREVKKELGLRGVCQGSNMESINQKQQKLIEEFEKISDWQERYRRLIERGRQLEKYPEDKYIDKYKVSGCQSQVWLMAELNSTKRY